MTKRYDAWATRVVPDVRREEFVNVGALVRGPEHEWAFRFTPALTRASALATEDLPTAAIQDALHRISGMVQESSRDPLGQLPSQAAALAAAELESVVARYSNLIQFSRPMRYLGDSADEVAARLFATLVPDSVRRSRSKTRTRIRKALTQVLSDVLGAFQPPALHHPQLSVGNYSLRMDLATRTQNGTGVGAIAEVVALDRRDKNQLQSEVLAGAFTLGQLRQRGGYIEAPNGTAHGYTVNPDVPLTIVHSIPNGRDEEKMLRLAQDAWASVPGLAVVSEASIPEAVASMDSGTR